MKRLFALVLVLIVTVSTVGCNAKDVLNRSLSRGILDGNVYTSEFIGFSFVKPDTWTYATDNEINEIMGAGSEIMGQTDYEAAVSELLNVYDMMATDANTGNNVNIVFENLKLSGSTDITEAEYLEIAKTNLQSVADLSYTFGETNNISLGGVEFSRLSCDVTYFELISMKQVMYVKRIEDYMVVISITIVDGTDTSVIEGYFTEIEQ